MTRKKAKRGKPGPKPGFMPVVNMRRAALRAAGRASPEADALYIERVRKDPIGSCKHLKTMGLAELRLCAKGLHLPQHNIDELTEDKLRQNCQMTVSSVIEALTSE